DALGLALGVLGVALIVAAPTRAPAAAGGPSLEGDLLLLGATVCWGVGTLLSAPVVRRAGPLPTTAWMTAFGALGLAPPALPTLLALDPGVWSLQAVAGMAYTGSAGWALGAALWYGAMRHLGAARVSIYANMESVFVVIFAAAFLGEAVEWTAVLGGAMVIAGVLLTRRAG